VYLAGAIRDNRPEDVEWRESVITALDGLAVFINPLGGKVFDVGAKKWTLSGVPSTLTTIVRHDAWSVDRCDIVLANVTALAERYPNIGTLIELGRAWGRGKLIYLILERGYTGHENSGMYSLHPFLADIAAVCFESTEAAVSFLGRHLRALSGVNPRFDGVK
jgi:nucleoside 2-deoxyribosyltransferase